MRLSRTAPRMSKAPCEHTLFVGQGVYDTSTRPQGFFSHLYFVCHQRLAFSYDSQEMQVHSGGYSPHHSTSLYWRNNPVCLIERKLSMWVIFVWSIIIPEGKCSWPFSFETLFLNRIKHIEFAGLILLCAAQLCLVNHLHIFLTSTTGRPSKTLYTNWAVCKTKNVSMLLYCTAPWTLVTSEGAIYWINYDCFSNLSLQFGIKWKGPLDWILCKISHLVTKKDLLLVTVRALIHLDKESISPGIAKNSKYFNLCLIKFRLFLRN